MGATEGPTAAATASHETTAVVRSIGKRCGVAEIWQGLGGNAGVDTLFPDMTLSRRTTMISWALFLAFAAIARPARAFVTDCHQGISTEALGAAAWPLGTAPPALSDQQRRLIPELPFDVSPDVTDFWTLSALVGNYYVDGGSTDAKDAVALAELTARPDLQREHCLRGPDDDGAAGEASALAACKAFMLEQLAAAHGDDDAPDLAAVENVRLHLVFTGDADVPLARYAFHLGQV